MIKKFTPPINDRGLSKDFLSYIHRTATLLEMWNVIESVGINREVVNKIFTTDEAVSELYQLIVKRIHHEREQEMIRRLRADVDELKLNSQTNLVHV